MRLAKPPKTPFTKDGYEKIKKDFQKLSQKRKEVLIRLQAAREMGDLSENGAYQGAKFELGSIDRQLRQLNYQLKYGEITESKNSGVIDFGSIVTLNDGTEKQTYTIVGTFESDPSLHTLSGNSPVGKAIMGKRVGDKAIVNTPNGQASYTIVRIGCKISKQ